MVSRADIGDEVIGETSILAPVVVMGGKVETLIGSSIPGVPRYRSLDSREAPDAPVAPVAQFFSGSASVVELTVYGAGQSGAPVVEWSVCGVGHFLVWIVDFPPSSEPLL